MKIHILNCLFDLKEVLKGVVGCGIYIYLSRQPSPTISLYAGIQFNSKLLNKKYWPTKSHLYLCLWETGTSRLSSCSAYKSSFESIKFVSS